MRPAEPESYGLGNHREKEIINNIFKKNSSRSVFFRVVTGLPAPNQLKIGTFTNLLETLCLILNLI